MSIITADDFEAILLLKRNYFFYLIFLIYRTDIDPWDWLAKLMNILETLDDKSIIFESEMKEGTYVLNKSFIILYKSLRADVKRGTLNDHIFLGGSLY